MSLLNTGYTSKSKAGVKARTAISTTLSAGQKIIQSSGKKFKKGTRKTRRVYIMAGLL